MVPNGWLHKQIGEIASIQVGRDLVEDKYSEISTTEYKYPVYSNTVENKGLYGFYNFPEYSGNAITIVGRGVGLGKAFARSPGESFGAIGRLLVLTPKNNSFDVIFFANYINFALRIHNESGGIPQLPGASLSKYFVMLPPLAEQQKIAQILSTWDKAIAVTEQLLANSQQQKKALMQQLLTGKKRLLDENGVGFEGEWKIHSLGSLGDTYTGLTGKSKEDFGSGKPYITYMNIFKNNRIDIKQVDYVNIHESENQNSVQYGDIFFTTSSETAAEVGMSAVLLDEIEELYLNSFCFGFRLHHFQIMHPEFAAYIFRSNEIRKQIAILGQGATRYNLSKNQLMKLELTLPNIEEQQKIAKVLSTSDQEIEALQHKLDCLQQEKKALMQQLLTGKRRVKVAA